MSRVLFHMQKQTNRKGNPESVTRNDQDGKGEERSHRGETDVGSIYWEHAWDHHSEHHLIVKLRIKTNCENKGNRAVKGYTYFPPLDYQGTRCQSRLIF